MANLRANKITTGTADYQGSIYASGTGAYLLTTTTAPGTDDFTIECWINSNDAGGTNQEGLFTINAQSDGTSGFQAGTSNQLRLVQGRDGTDGQNGGLEVNIVGTVVGTGDGNDIIQEGTWHHVAVTRASGTVKIWVDGVEKASGSAAGDVTGTTFLTGYYDQNYTYQGYMSNFRYRKGTAHYTTTFTPPTGPLERTSDTELLFAQSANNAGDGYSSAIHGGTTDIMKVLGNVTANTSAPTLTTSSSVGVVFEGDTKVNTQGYMYFPTGDTSQRGRGRGAFAMTTNYPNTSNAISYIDIASQGNAKDFGDLTAAGRYGCGNSSATRGVSGGGLSRMTTMDYFTLATTGNAISFGTLTYNVFAHASVANSTRIVWISGENPNSSPDVNINTMTYITVATTGNGTDFGDYDDSDKATYIGGNISNSTRGLAYGGNIYPGNNIINKINYITIATTGNSSDFGELSQVNSGAPGCSDTTRGVIFGGYGSSPLAALNTIDYVTIATTGNATDFGDIPAAKQYGAACSNSIRGVHCAGGYPGTDNSMSYVTIQTTGNSQDFGDLNTGNPGGDSCENNNFSDSHGGLS